MEEKMKKERHPAHEEIFERIIGHKKEYGKRWKEEYFNNFRMLMPANGEFCWMFQGRYLDRVWEGDGASGLLRGQTHRQFRDNIIKTIKQTRRTNEQLTAAVYRTNGLEYSFNIFFPIYVILREMGYSESDLQQ